MYSRGGFVSSALFDHTSVLRFLETRFGAEVPNLSAWRRVTVGDLTSAFNFTKPDQSIPALLPTLPAIPQILRSVQPAWPVQRHIKYRARRALRRRKLARRLDQVARAKHPRILGWVVVLRSQPQPVLLLRAPGVAPGEASVFRSVLADYSFSDTGSDSFFGDFLSNREINSRPEGGTPTLPSQTISLALRLRP